VAGEVLRGFGRGPAGDNRGIDIGVAPGTPVKAAATGRVTYAGTPAQAYGPLVIVDHGAEFHTVYANLRQASVKRGDTVTAGQGVGVSGEQATTPLPHLHFEVRHKGEPVDPLLLLPPR
jgi:lipoprotein NlpD